MLILFKYGKMKKLSEMNLSLLSRKILKVLSLLLKADS